MSCVFKPSRGTVKYVIPVKPVKKNRGIGEIDSVDRQSNNEETSDENKMENFQMRDVMQGISNIQTTLANLLLRTDGHGQQIDTVTSEISGKHGIEERLENVQHQANDTMYIINELQEKQKKKNGKRA